MIPNNTLILYGKQTYYIGRTTQIYTIDKMNMSRIKLMTVLPLVESINTYEDAKRFEYRGIKKDILDIKFKHIRNDIHTIEIDYESDVDSDIDSGTYYNFL